jgi:hypothetical protein
MSQTPHIHKYAELQTKTISYRKNNPSPRAAIIGTTTITHVSKYLPIFLLPIVDALSARLDIRLAPGYLIPQNTIKEIVYLSINMAYFIADVFILDTSEVPSMD